MNEPAILKLSGKDRYCPDCGRILVRALTDGTIELSQGSGVVAMGTVDDEGKPENGEVVDATCLLCHPEHAKDGPPADDEHPLKQLLSRLEALSRSSLDNDGIHPSIRTPW